MRVFGAAAVPNDTRLEMMAKKLDPERIESGTDGGDLVEDIDAIPILFEHALQAGDLAGDAADAGLEFGSVSFFHRSMYTPIGYISTGSYQLWR